MNLKFVSFYIRQLVSSGKKKPDKQLRSAIFATAVCLVPLIVVLGVANGMIEGILSRFVEIDSSHLQLVTYDDWSDEDWLEAKNVILTTPNVQSAVLEWQGQGVLVTEDSRKGVRIRAVEDGYFDSVEINNFLAMDNGDFDLSQQNSVLLAASLSDELGLKPGDELRLMTAGTDARGKELTKMSKLQLRGTFSTGYQELDRSFILIGFEKGKKLSFGSSGSFSIGIRIDKPFTGSLEKVQAELQEKFSGRANIYNWKELNAARIETFAMTKMILIIIMVLILLVAAVNISSNMIALVSQRMSEIAIMKALGAGISDIRAIFLLSGLFSGIIGTFFGMASGFFISININELIRLIETLLNSLRQIINVITGQGQLEEIRIFYSSFYLEKIPVRFSVVEIISVGFFALLISLVSSWLPAAKAAKLKPLDILSRH